MAQWISYLYFSFHYIEVISVDFLSITNFIDDGSYKNNK